MASSPAWLRWRYAIPLSFLLANLDVHASVTSEVAAVVVNPTTESRAVLRQTVSATLHRESVLLSSDVLTQDSAFVVEPVRNRDAQGQVIYDRKVRTVEHFRLVTNGRACILIRESTGERFNLGQTHCTPRP
jgi:hypothetical protein